MNYKRNYFFVIILVIPLITLTMLIINRNKIDQTISEIDSKVDLPTSKSNQADLSTSITEKEQLNELIEGYKQYAGRVDPFKKLAIELNTKTQQAPGNLNEPVPILPKILSESLINNEEQHSVGVIKGILYGTDSTVLIERRDGTYQKFNIGDVLAVGTVISIDLESVSIRRDGVTTNFKLGEEL